MDPWMKQQQPSGDRMQRHLTSKNSRFRNRALESSLKDFYGEERGMLEAETFQERPMNVGELVDDWLREMVTDDKILIRFLKDHWEEVVSPAYRTFFEPVGLQGEELRIEILNPSATYAAAQLEKTILERMPSLIERSGVKHANVSRVAFLLGGVEIQVGKSISRYSRRSRGRSRRK